MTNNEAQSTGMHPSEWIENHQDEVDVVASLIESHIQNILDMATNGGVEEQTISEALAQLAEKWRV